MESILSLTMVLVFVSYSFICIVKGICNLFYRDRGLRRCLFIVPVGQNTTEVEYELRQVFSRLSWSQTVSACTVAVADMGLAAENAEICKRFCTDRGINYIAGDALSSFCKSETLQSF